MADVDRLMQLVYEHDELGDLDGEERRRALTALATRTVDENDVAAAVASAEAELFGWGPLQDALKDPAVTDVLVNGPDEVWIDRAGGLERIAASFRDVQHLTQCTYRWFARHGGRIDHLHPIADVTTADGIRLHATLPPIAPDGPSLSLRRIGRGAIALDDLEALGCLTSGQRVELESLVHDGATLAISGRTGCGKTTFLNALCGVVPEHERLVVIEETRELRCPSAHVVSLVARDGNAEGLGEVLLDDLVRAALRMRPDRIVIGEVRGIEAWPALRALTTGHAGSMLTVHADGAADVADTLAFLALRAARGCSRAEIAAGFERAIDVVVHMERDGASRRVAEMRHRA